MMESLLLLLGAVDAENHSLYTTTSIVLREIILAFITSRVLLLSAFLLARPLRNDRYQGKS